MKNNLFTLLGQSAEPEKIMDSNVPEGEYSIDFVFPSANQVTIAFKPSFIKTPGTRSIDPMVPDDPDIIVCDGLEITSIFEYDPNGGESVIPLSYEISEAFKEWIKDTDYLNVDLYDF